MLEMRERAQLSDLSIFSIRFDSPNALNARDLRVYGTRDLTLPLAKTRVTCSTVSAYAAFPNISQRAFEMSTVVRKRRNVARCETLLCCYLFFFFFFPRTTMKTALV